MNETDPFNCKHVLIGSRVNGVDTNIIHIEGQPNPLYSSEHMVKITIDGVDYLMKTITSAKFIPWQDGMESI